MVTAFFVPLLVATVTPAGHGAAGIFMRASGSGVVVTATILGDVCVARGTSTFCRFGDVARVPLVAGVARATVPDNVGGRYEIELVGVGSGVPVLSRRMPGFTQTCPATPTRYDIDADAGVGGSRAAIPVGSVRYLPATGAATSFTMVIATLFEDQSVSGGSHTAGICL